MESIVCKMVALPLELWLHIFRFTDTSTFNAILDYLYQEDIIFAKVLHGIVCRDIVKKNRKLILINRLIHNPSFYRKNTTYLKFRLDYTKEDNILKFPYNKMLQTMNEQNKQADSYKHFMISNKDLCFENEKDYNLFIHQTKTRRDETTDILDKFNYYDNKVSIRDIFLLTKDMDIKLPTY